jgi:hypothetical protein
MGNAELYARSYTGTKTLIDNFNSEILAQLDDIASTKNTALDLKSKIDLLKDLRHSYGNSALLLSGGGSLGKFA